jgi:hypothetical protein
MVPLLSTTSAETPELLLPNPSGRLPDGICTVGVVITAAEFSPEEELRELLLLQVSFLKLKSPILGFTRRRKAGLPLLDRLNSAAIAKAAPLGEPHNPKPVFNIKVKALCSS